MTSSVGERVLYIIYSILREAPGFLAFFSDPCLLFSCGLIISKTIRLFRDFLTYAPKRRSQFFPVLYLSSSPVFFCLQSTDKPTEMCRSAVFCLPPFFGIFMTKMSPASKRLIFLSCILGKIFSSQVSAAQNRFYSGEIDINRLG